MFKAFTLFAIGIAIFAVQPTTAYARESQFQAHAKSGEPTRIRTFYNCKRHLPGGGGGAFVEHGTVTVKYVIQNRCGNANEPTNEIWYTSTPGFKGLDTVTLPLGGRTKVNIEVTVE